MESRNHLIIFVKNPLLGKVKTRLAAAIGDEKALEVYLQLLDITRSECLKTACTRNIFYSDEITDDAWDNDHFNKFVQQGNDLGERMNNAFEQVFALGAKKAMIIGSDCPQLSSKLLEEAFSCLDEKDAIIGPATDGGYYLLGMKKPRPYLFENKEWSTDSVFASTISDFEANRISFHQLQELSDLDTINDLDLLKSHL